MSQVSLNDVNICNNYYGFYKVIGGKKVFQEIGRAFDIDCISQNFETGNICFKLATEYGGKKVFCDIDRGDFDARGVKKLRSAGFDVKMSSLEVFQSTLDVLEENYLEKSAVSLCHEGVGWEKITSDNTVENLNAPLGYIYKYYGKIGNIKSTYRGDLDIKPRGRLKEQISFIKLEVQGYTPCETAVAIGLSAVINGLIGDVVKTPNIVVHFYGDSSRGKTTAAQLAVSVAGIPDLNGISLMKPWNSTANAIISRCKGNRGMPIAIDEISKYLGGNLTLLLYSLSDGRDKERLNKDATLKRIEKHDSFLTTIISTGEATMLSKCNNNTGLKARVIEIEAEFTKNAKHANSIKKGCFENCGWLAPKFALYLQKKGMEYIVGKHTYWTDEYCKHTTVKTLKERVAANYAIILTAAELANEAFDFSFNLEEMLTFLVENETDNSSDRDLADVAHEKLIEFARSHYSHFTKVYHNSDKLSTDNVENTFVYGRIDEGLEKKVDGKTVTNEFCFLSSCFPDITSKLGFEDSKIVLQKLRDAGYLNHETGKLYRKRKLRDTDSTTSKMYVIYDFAEYESAEYQDTFTEIEDFENPFEEKGNPPPNCGKRE